MSYAQITIVGRLGRDPETKMTSTGKQIVTASVAVGKDDKTQWYKINAWEQTGKWLSDARKGDFVFAQGTLQLGIYTKKDGTTAIDASINASVIRANGKRDSVPEYSAQSANMAVGQDFFEDIPF
jgi:single-strand DNA-binding protein